MRPIRLTSLIALGAGAVLVLSACGSSSSSAPEPAPNDSGDAAAVTCATVDKAGTDLLAKVCAAGKIIVSTDPAYPPQSSLDPRDQRVRRLRHRRGHRDRQAARRHDRRGRRPPGTSSPPVAGTGAGTRPWGRCRRPTTAQKVLTSRQPTTTRRPSSRCTRTNTTINDLEHRPRRQEDRRLPRLHLRAVPEQDARDPRATPSTSSSTTPRSPATTPTRRRCRTCARRRHAPRRRDHRRSRRSRAPSTRATRSRSSATRCSTSRWPSPSTRRRTARALAAAVEQDRRGHARGRHADRDVEEVVRTGPTTPSRSEYCPMTRAADGAHRGRR